ncbi:acyltransferase [Demequina sp. SYSU T00192]|uniref:Acyltransferase n=1 Tax=Demequina litoralis TaxID=3051660 RepID=A0ABT8G8H9_9MICO|nr:acyltransferase [Demequina sp. SYSU T00192]MDN4475445.1 acyltransferase [Demequina sp. SYSU T00192]
MGGRDKVVDSLRGIACILLVTLHVAHNRWGQSDSLEWYADTFIYIRMPLFAFLSGVVYAWRPLTSAAGYGTYMSKKVRRLLVPYVIFVLAMGVFQLVLGDSARAADPWNWLLYSLTPYWFLLATFWVYAVIALLDSRQLLETKTRVGILFGVLLAANLLFNLQDTTAFLQFTSAAYLGLFFVAGLAATRFGWKDIGPTGAWIVTGITVVAFAYTQLAVNGVWAVADSQRQDPLGIVLGIAFPLAFIAFGLKNNFLAWIGSYSYGIFLMHPFAIMATSGALQVAGVTALVPSIIVLSIAGIFGPILGVLVLRKFAVGRVIIGERARKPKAVAAAPAAPAA